MCRNCSANSAECIDRSGDRPSPIKSGTGSDLLDQPGPVFLNSVTKRDALCHREWRGGSRVLVNVYRWDLERKNQLDAPLDIGLYMKLIEELEKMKTG